SGISTFKEKTILSTAATLGAAAPARILIVEDNPVDVKVLRFIFEQALGLLHDLAAAFGHRDQLLVPSLYLITLPPRRTSIPACNSPTPYETTSSVSSEVCTLRSLFNKMVEVVRLPVWLLNIRSNKKLNPLPTQPPFKLQETLKRR